MKIRLIAAKVIACERVAKSDKLLKETLDVGGGVTKTVCSGIAKYYTPEEMVGKTVVMVNNFAPRKMAGQVSEGMLLCAEDPDEQGAPADRGRRRGPRQRDRLIRTTRPPRQSEGAQAVKKTTESSRGPKPSRISIVPGGVYGGKVACPKGKQVASRPTKRNQRFRFAAAGRIFAAENPIFQSKNRFLADFAPGDFEEILSKSGRGGSGGGACSPAHQLVKTF